MSQKVTIDGVETEVFTADEVQAATVAAVTLKETEFGTIKNGLETELGTTKKALAERTSEFAQFRKLNDEQVAKLSEAERTIYENGVALNDEREKNQKIEKDNKEKALDAAIRVKAGTDDKLFTKMKETYAIINIDAQTPEEVERKLNMVIGAIQTTEPNLVAAIPGFSGSFEPKKPELKEGETFADTPAGKKAAAELGLTLEVPKK